jgi:hypothetical protein
MAHTNLASIEVESTDPAVLISQIAERSTKDIRHADVITHDPEGQRIRAIIVAACWAAYELALPKDDGKTSHVTTGENVKFVLHGLAPDALPKPSYTGQAADTVVAVTCAQCKKIHDPRKQYDHAVKAAKPKKRLGGIIG